jgi:putative hemolysin
MNAKIKNVIIAFVLGLFVLAACSARTEMPETATPTLDTINIANPASAYCEEQGGELETRTAPDGSQYGVCMFEDNTECEEWAYYRGECKPGDMDGMWLPLRRGLRPASPTRHPLTVWNRAALQRSVLRKTAASSARAYFPMGASARSGLSSEGNALHELCGLFHPAPGEREGGNS